MSDAFCIRQSSAACLGTEKLAMELQCTEEGAYLLRSLKHLSTGKEYVQAHWVYPDEFSITVDGTEICGSSGGFVLEGVQTATLKQGELEATVALRRDDLRIERHYILYPGLAVVQSYTVYQNLAGHAVQISRPSLYIIRLLTEERERVDFSYMTGGANFTGSQIFKTIPVGDGFVKEFDSMGEPEIMRVDNVEGNTWHPRMNGCAVWNEFFSMKNRDLDEGFWMTFDYQGWWKATMSCCDGQSSAA